MLAMTHSPEIGTVIEGVEHEPGSASVLHDLGWAWSPALRCWAMPGTRGLDALLGIMTCTARALSLAGFEVVTLVRPR